MYHPDKNPGRENTSISKFQLVQTAYEVLSDPIKRGIYEGTRNIASRGMAAFTKPSTEASQSPKRKSQSTTENNGSPKTPKRSASDKVKTPESKANRQSGTTFQNEKSSKHTFHSFNSDCGPFQGTDKKEHTWSESPSAYSFSFPSNRRESIDKDHTWSGSPSAYSHVFKGAKEDLRSALKRGTESRPQSRDGNIKKQRIDVEVEANKPVPSSSRQWDQSPFRHYSRKFKTYPYRTWSPRSKTAASA
jgi:curved DNA-binding protein CbpA